MLRVWPITLCLAVAYFLAGYAGLMLPAAGSHITLVWLPTGIAVGTLCRWGVGCWPGVMIGALAVNLAIGSSFSLSLCIALGNTLGPLLATAVLVRTGFHRDVKRSQDILLLTVAAMLGMLVTASVGVTSLGLARQLTAGSLSAWLIWWAGDVTGVIAAAPLIMVTSRSKLRDLWGRRIEFICWVVSITLSITVVFFLNGSNGKALATAFIPFPLLVWAAIRFGPVGTSLGVISLSFGAVCATSAGYGPFYGSEPTHIDLTLSLFMATTAVVGWLVSALTASQLEAIGTRRILERALEEASFGVVVSDVNRSITFVNSGFTRLTGYSEAELIGRSCAVLQGPDTDPQVSRELKAALDGTASFDGDILNYRKDGSTFWNALLITPILNKLGEKTGFLGIQRDVTDRKREQLALALSEERFRAIFELEPECVKIVSPYGRLEEMNPAGLAMIEADSLEQVRGARLESLIAPKDRATFRALNERVIKLGESGSCTFAITGLKGTHRWLETRAVPYRNEHHEIVGLLAVTRDITLQKAATAELERTVTTLKLFIDSVPAIITFVDADQTLRMINKRGEQFFGLPAEELQGRHIGDIHSPEAFAVVGPRIRKALSGETVRYQDSMRRPDGNQFWYEALYIPRQETDGRVLGIFVMVFDISERMRAEAALKESEARLNSFFFESPVGMAMFDSEGRWSHMNPTLAAINGFSAESHIGKRPNELLAPELAAVITASVRHTLETGEADINREVSGVTPDHPGVMRHWLFTQSPLLGPDQRITGVGVVVIETTAQKQSEQALRASEERFRMYVNHAPNGVYVIDAQGRYTDVNPAACRQTGYSRDEILSMGITDLTPPETVEQALQAFEKLRADGIVEVEQPLRCKSGETRWFTLAAARLSDGDFIGFTSDIQRLKETENALRQSRDRFEYLVSSCPAVIYTARTSGDYAATFISENVRSLLGYEPQQFLAESDFWASRLHSDDASGILEGLATLLESGRYTHEYRFLSSTGEYRWLGDEMILSRDTHGEPSEIIGYLIDITDRKRVEQSLTESETLFRTLATSAPVGIFVTDQSGSCQFVNERCCLIMGLTSDESLGDGWLSALHPEDLKQVHTKWNDAMLKAREFSLEYRFLSPSGKVVWVQGKAIPFYLANEQVAGYVGTITDLTDLLQARKVLRESEDRLRLALEAAAAIAFVWDAVSDSVVRYYSTEPALPMNSDNPDTTADVQARIHPDDRERFDAGIAACLAHGSEYRNLYRVVRSDGTARWLEEWGTLSRDQTGRPLRLTGISIDVTDQKNATLALQEAELRQRFALDAGRMGTWDWEIGSDHIACDDRQQMLFGFEPGAFDTRVVTFLNRVHPDDLAGVRQMFADAAVGKDFDAEFRIRLATGEIRWIHGSGVFVPKSDHRPLRLVGINYDITERKRAEDTVRQILDGIGPRTGRQFFRVLVDYLCNVCETKYAFVGVLEQDHPNLMKTIAVSHRGQAAENFTYDLRATPCEHVFGRSFCSYPTGVQQTFPQDKLLVEMGIDAYLGTPLWFSNGEALGLIVLLHDQPMPNPAQAEVVLKVVAARAGAELERQQADAALRESEEQLRIFVESAPVGVAMLDQELRYLSYSQRWLTDYGLGGQNLIGRSHYEVFPEIPDRWEEIHRRCLTGVSERCEQDRFERADGTADYLRWEIQPWTDATGAIGGLVFFTELITDQVIARQQLQASLREKESMLKEIHHRVKNNLQVISSLLSLQAASVTQTDALDVLAESQNRVRAMALVHETLYRSSNLADVDLSRYLGELCGYLFRSYGMDSTRVRLDLDVEAVCVSLDKTIPCGLIVNEIVSNSLKHAFPGNRSGNITVRARTEKDGRLRLTLTDDGIGLPTDLVVDRTPSLGLKLIEILTEQLGGEVTIERTPGTRFELLFPHDQSGVLSPGNPP